MWGLIFKLGSSAGGLLAILAIVAGLVGMGAYEEHKIDNGRYEKLVAAQAQATAKALAEAQAKQAVFDQLAVAAAQKDRDDQAARATQAEAQLREVGNHVSVQTITRSCVPYGLVRVLDAAASGRSTNSLREPAGKSDGSCSPLSWNALARSVVANYYTDRANAGQLNALIGFIRQAQKAR